MEMAVMGATQTSLFFAHEGVDGNLGLHSFPEPLKKAQRQAMVRLCPFEPVGVEPTAEADAAQ